MDEMLFNRLLSEEVANKLKEMLKDVPEPVEEVKKETKKVKVKEAKETKEATPKGETKEATPDNNTGEEEVKKEIRVNSMNLAMAVKFLTLAKCITVRNKDKKTMSKYKNYFLFENTESVRKALEILNLLKTELRKEQLEKMKEGKK